MNKLLYIQAPASTGRVTRRAVLGLALGGAAAALSGCPGPGAGGAGGGAQGASAGVRQRLEFWHTRRGAQEEALKTLCSDYNAKNPNVEIVPIYQGSYNDLNKKIRGAVQAKALPALTVAYESHVSEYMANGVVRPLDNLVEDSQHGFSAAELADIHPQYLESNRFQAYDNQLLSFPFTKSNLVMYHNLDLIRKAGFQGAPKTWPEFEQQAAALTKLIGKPAFAFSVDPSTLDGLVYSHGGEVLAPDGKTTLFDQPPTVRAFEVLDRMAKAKTLTEVSGDDSGPLFASQMCAFTLDSSSGRTYMEELIADKFQWDLAVIPHAEGVEPVTVMYGPNVCIFKAVPEQELAAWDFVKYFISPEVTARWARETGYLPVRKSAVELPEMKEFYEKNPRGWHVYQILPMAKGEPNVVGWQEVRNHLEEAARKVISGTAAPAAAAAELKQKADQALAGSQ